MINVDDENDERPLFTKKFYVFRVWENELPGTNVSCLHPLITHPVGTTLSPRLVVRRHWQFISLLGYRSR